MEKDIVDPALDFPERDTTELFGIYRFTTERPAVVKIPVKC